MHTINVLRFSCDLKNIVGSVMQNKPGRLAFIPMTGSTSTVFPDHYGTLFAADIRVRRNRRGAGFKQYSSTIAK